MTQKHIRRKITANPYLPQITGFQEAFSQSEALSNVDEPMSNNYSNQIKMTQPAKKRLKPYIWVTWISSLMGNEKQCKYTAWFSAHYQFAKRESGYDSSAHDEMVSQRVIQHKAQGFATYVEDENSFTIKGETCGIAGKPDIVVEAGQPIIEDCKSGKRKEAHRMQVLIYMLLFPLSGQGKKLCQARTPAGRLIYPDGVIEISPSEVDKQFVEFFRQTVAIISGSASPTQAPSYWECQYCSIPSPNCSAKLDAENGASHHDLF